MMNNENGQITDQVDKKDVGENTNEV